MIICDSQFLIKSGKCYYFILYIKLKLWVCPLIARERIYTNLPLTWHAHTLKIGRDFRKVRTLKKVSLVPVPVRVVSIAQKLSIVEEQHQDQRCLFR
jgi:hypothetical protein